MIHEMNESAKQALLVADILNYTRKGQSEEGLEPSNAKIVSSILSIIPYM